MQNRKRDTDVQNRILDSVGEGEGGMFQENSIKTCILSRVKQITSPGWMHEPSARTWCTGKTQQDKFEEERQVHLLQGSTGVKIIFIEENNKLKQNQKKKNACQEQKIQSLGICLKRKYWSDTRTQRMWGHLFQLLETE